MSHHSRVSWTFLDLQLGLLRLHWNPLSNSTLFSMIYSLRKHRLIYVTISRSTKLACFLFHFLPWREIHPFLPIIKISFPTDCCEEEIKETPDWDRWICCQQCWRCSDGSCHYIHCLSKDDFPLHEHKEWNIYWHWDSQPARTSQVLLHSLMPRITQTELYLLSLKPCLRY